MIPESGLEGARTDVDDLKRRPLGGVMRPPRGRKKTPIELNGKFSSARLEGPYTRGKYAQSGPGTRSRCRSKSLTQISRRLRLLCALCREDPAEMAHPLAAAGSARPRSRVGAKPHVPPPRRRGDTYGSSVKNGAGVGCDVDVNGKARPSSSELPEEDAVRSVATPVCGLRGACESALKVKKCGKKAPDTSGLVICIGQYPKVKLCDVSQRCDAYRRDRCYKLPEVLKTKSVRCFKRELEAGVRLKPISPRGSQCGFKKNDLAESAVFTDYYQNNSPGVFFSNNVVTCLLLALLKAGLFMDVLSVLNVSLTHKIMPVPEVMLELFNVVQVKDLTAIAPELTRLTSQMSILGLPSVDGAQMTPDFHGNSPLANPVNHMLLPPPTTTTTSNGFSESLNLAHAVVEVELCTKHKNWPRLGLVLKLMCQSNLLPGDLEQLGGRIAVALLTEINNKQPIPFATFTDTVCQERGDDLVKTTLGRIGVSLMLRYHRTHQWAKGRQVVEILSGVQVAFSTLKGFFGNENAVSRCSLITMATELFVLSGSIEGALSTLRANEWFLASCSWPCEPRDLEKRTHVLMRLAESTSHRDTLEIFSKLPGIKEPHESIDISQYGAVFNAHLQTCVERWMLPVASDLVELMLCKQLAAEAGLLQTLFNKLGQQNLWLRARGIFKRALNAGYYPVVALPPDLQSLCVPSSLGGMEMALCLEMFVTANLTSVLNEADTTLSTSSLCITLQRSNTCEGEYLSASSRLLSAAAVLQPKLTLHFTAVNPSQEQVFTLDMPSVRLWLQHNRSQANEVWSDLS
ncbi:unnamed protein product [Merluccius merluccius]